MNKIYLGGKNSDKYALVDDEDFENISKNKWSLSSGGYAYRSVPPYNRKKKNFTVFMHREIMNTPKGLQTDHINHNKLDNQKSNLRVCTSSENGANRFADKDSVHSKYKGVTKHKRSGAWVAQIHYKKQKYWIGSFKTEIDAYIAYQTKAKQLFGEFAV